MQPVEQDLKFIESTCQSLEDYILSDQQYWPVDGQPSDSGFSSSRATLGLLYLSLELVRHRALNEKQTERLHTAQTTIDRVHRKWKVAWEKKVAGEFRSRLRLWQNFISEAKTDPQTIKSRYRSEVRNRTILQLLLLDLSMDESELILSLHKVDEWINATLPKGSFIWEDEMQPAFSEEKFWFLYRQLKE